MINSITENCPLCGNESVNVYSLNKKFIFEQLELYFGEQPPEQIEIVDYQINRCKNCSLEYALPQQPGSQPFYQWITTRPGYYPKSRWDWFAVIEQVKKQQTNNSVSILEVGCGKGNFIEIANKINNFHVVGLDTTSESVEMCRSKGFEAYCETIESFQANISQKKFDYVVSFHCLEHVNEPKNFVASMLSVLKPEGSIFISTPHSPMSFEQGWFDIMNNPPHHITRWNKEAYDELSRQLNCSVQYWMPPAKSALVRAISTFRFSAFGNRLSPSSLKILLTLVTQPLAFFKILVHQFKRSKINGQVAADVVLVELKPLKN